MIAGTRGAKEERDRLLELVRKHCTTEGERTIFEAFVTFNTSILKTNFYKPSKRAISFRLEPSILASASFAEQPFGVFMVIGAEFRGFHVRFRDIARGGIRLIRSRYPQAFNDNVSALFDECFNLASTQQRKNKDIPEGGSKGVILLGWEYQDKGTTAFRKYIDALLDCMLPDSQYMVDHYDQEELLFLGPDEGTADFMDWCVSLPLTHTDKHTLELELKLTPQLLLPAAPPPPPPVSLSLSCIVFLFLLLLLLLLLFLFLFLSLMPAAK